MTEETPNDRASGRRRWMPAAIVGVVVTARPSPARGRSVWICCTRACSCWFWPAAHSSCTGGALAGATDRRLSALGTVLAETGVAAGRSLPPFAGRSLRTNAIESARDA